VLFARQKGDLAAYVRGLGAISSLKDGDVVLVAEGCTHRRQCNDIGTVKIPKALRKISGRELSFSFSSGGTFAVPEGGAKPALVVHCGGCMLTRREVRRRIALAEEAGVPIVNYGLLLAVASGLGIDEVMP
jgi:predicted GTPase